MKTVQYRNLKFRVFAALFAALYILFHGRPPDFVDAFTAWEFYVQLALSFTIALGLIYLVHYMTKRLDKYYDWRSNRAMRMRYQFDLCVLLPTFLDALFFYFYFKDKGENIFDNGFFWIDLPIVTGLFALLSGYYWIYFLSATDREISNEITLRNKISESDSESDNPVNDEELEIKRKGILVRFNVREDVLYFFRSGKAVYFKSIEGNLYKVNDSINDLIIRFSSCGFIQINPGVILNKKIIIGYKNSDKRHTYEVLVRKKYENTIGESRNHLLIVTREYLKNIKKSLEQF